MENILLECLTPRELEGELGKKRSVGKVRKILRFQGLNVAYSLSLVPVRITCENNLSFEFNALSCFVECGMQVDMSNAYTNRRTPTKSKRRMQQ